MKKKPVLYRELAYFLGLLLLSCGNALAEKAGLGLSMVIAPAYILHLKISEFLPFYSFGMSGYILQSVLLIVLIFITRKARIGYLFSFVTAVINGFLIDTGMLLFGNIVVKGLFRQIFLFILSLPLTAAGIALLLYTYLSPEVYDLFVKEIVRKFNKPLSVVKTVYDLASLALAFLLTLLLFGEIRGLGVGTLICALVNGWLVGRFSALYARIFEPRDALPLKKYFE